MNTNTKMDKINDIYEKETAIKMEKVTVNKSKKVNILNLAEVKEYLGVNAGHDDTNTDEITSAKVLVTPKQARYILRHTNKLNRRINNSHVETLKRDMENGKWYSDIDYIGFDKNGRLVNGQHRLKALSECTSENIVQNGIYLKFDFDVEQHISMDTGNTRKYTDQVTISKKYGMEILPNKFKSIISTGLKLNNPKINLSNSELLDIWSKYKEDLLTCEENGLFNLGSKAGTSVKSSLFWAYLSGVDINILSHFAEVLRNGITKADTDIPIIRLRDELVDLRGTSKALDMKRALYTQQCIYNVLQGSTSNRLPANPTLKYQDYPFLENI